MAAVAEWAVVVAPQLAAAHSVAAVEVLDFRRNTNSYKPTD